MLDINVSKYKLNKSFVNYLEYSVARNGIRQSKFGLDGITHYQEIFMKFNASFIFVDTTTVLLGRWINHDTVIVY